MKKKLTVILVAAAVLIAAAAGILMNYHIIDGQLYAKKAEQLDLRGKEITLAHYEALTQAMPACEILWDVPLGNGSYPSDSRELAVTDLEEALEMLAYFPELKVLDAAGCDDLSRLPELKEVFPELDVRFAFSVDGNACHQDTRQLAVSAVTEQELALVPLLTGLEQVTLIEGAEETHLVQLGEYCREQGIQVQLQLNGQAITDADKELTIEHINDVQARLLTLMPQLETVHMPEPEAKPELLFALEEKLPDAAITWEKTLLGVTYSRDVTEIDLTDILSRAEGESADKKTAYERGMELPVMGTREKVPSSVRILANHPLPDRENATEQLIQEIEAAMAYFPEAEKLEMCGAWLNNEAMAQFRERHREDYKVVWTVRCGDLAIRTDATFFMPTKYNVPVDGFSDMETYNLRYCEQMVAVDLGHMIIRNLEFVRYMPELKYLDLTLTRVKDLSPLSSCKKLVFLVLINNKRIEDYSPLRECTALEDLNISLTFGDISPILEMTWLKNLWMVRCTENSYRKATEALPRTYIGYDLEDPSVGWRSLRNYFNMRDAMLMFYMK